MPNKDKNIPKRRFKEFENADAWEQRKLGEVIEKLKGGVSIAPNDYIEDGYRTIPKGAVNDTGVADMSACKNVSVDFFEKNYFSKTSTGELITSLRDLVPSAPNLGRIVRIVGQFEEFIMPQGVYSLKITDNLLEDFLIAYSNNYIYRSVIQSEKNGSTQVHIRNGEFLNIKIQVPSLPEQEAIGNFFSTLDRHITLHQRKLDKLKSVKQAYLSEMFPAEGERVPKSRFPGFTDDWELRKLRNIFHNIENAFVGIATPHYVSDGRFYLESNNIKDGQVNYETKVFISEEFYQRQKNKWLRAGDIVMVQSGHVGHSAVIPEELDCSAAHALIMFRKQKVKISSNFLNYQFQTKQSKIKLDLITTGNTIKHILSSEMKEFNANFPSHPEQETIGTFFSTLDRHITLHQRKSI